jgi:hypothetical protein
MEKDKDAGVGGERRPGQILQIRKIAVRGMAASCLTLDFFSLACINLMR